MLNLLLQPLQVHVALAVDHEISNLSSLLSAGDNYEGL